MNLSIFLSLFLAVFFVGEARWIPEDVCLLPGSTGSCRAGFPRYYYNAVQQRCLQFTYGGCGGNRNNFRYQYECERACRCIKACPKSYTPVCGTDGETYPNLCSLDIASCKSNNVISLDYEGECD